jgi:hypothetical protein
MVHPRVLHDLTIVIGRMGDAVDEHVNARPIAFGRPPARRCWLGPSHLTT